MTAPTRVWTPQSPPVRTSVCRRRSRAASRVALSSAEAAGPEPLPAGRPVSARRLPETAHGPRGARRRAAVGRARCAAPPPKHWRPASSSPPRCELLIARPSPAPDGARDQLDPPHRRDVPGASVRVALKLTLKLNVKTIAHGPALRHHLNPADRWERRPAYIASARRLCKRCAAWFISRLRNDAASAAGRAINPTG